jgi:hypothetical protein
VCLNSKKALVVQQTVRERNTRRIPLLDRYQIGRSRQFESGVLGERGDEDVIQERGQESGGAQLVGEVEGERATERGMGEDSGVEVRSESGFGFGVAARLRLDLRPDPGLVGFGFGRRETGNHIRRRVVLAIGCGGVGLTRWHGAAWRGVAWRGVVWCGVAWRGVVWCGVV